MASDHTMDIEVNFDFQEMKNAVDQAQRDSKTRYDLKDSNVEIELSNESVKVNAQSDHQIEAVYGILIQKMIGRGLSPKILDRQKMEEAGGMRMRQEMKLVKALDSENSKKISKLVRENFPKAKPVIQGDTIRISSQSIDDLQAISRMLRDDESIVVPLEFGNYK